MAGRENSPAEEIITGLLVIAVGGTLADSGGAGDDAGWAPFVLDPPSPTLKEAPSTVLWVGTIPLSTELVLAGASVPEFTVAATFVLAGGFKVVRSIPDNGLLLKVSPGVITTPAVIDGTTELTTG